MFNIVLYSPEIPQNVGNIGRTCVLTNTKLHLIRPFLFDLNEKAVRRAGLDYWKDLNLEVHNSLEDFLAKYGHMRIFLSTTKGEKVYSEANFADGDFIMFGRESSGLPQEIREKYKDTALKIPMISTTDRSLNLSNSVAIVLYDALRQTNFVGMN